MNPYDPQYQQKSKSISSAEPNYFVHFAMRYPVRQQQVDIPINANNIKNSNKFNLVVV